jgi:acyl-coenzyme A thioesterase PaaI-like protein
MALQQISTAETDQQIAFFQAIPWCAAHLSGSTPHTPVVMGLSLTQRRRNAPEDLFFSHTLNAPGALVALLNFYSPRPPAVTDPKGPLGPEPLITRIRAFAALGPMLSGWDGICHGGVVVTLMDETMAQLFVANRDHGLLPKVPVMTVYLNTRFVKPARTGTAEDPVVVMVTVRAVKREGRKFFLEADVQDAEGAVLARAEAMFVIPRSML